MTNCKLVSTLYLFSLLVQIISCQNNCERLCNENIDWDKFQQFCAIDINNSTDPNLYTTFTNLYCPSGITISSCISNVDLLEVVYPGSCGCPNYCNSNLNRGQCIQNQCECNDGWSGPDCSQVTNENLCSNHGNYYPNRNTCQCDDGYAMNDCSTDLFLASIPPVVMTVDVNQYSPDDHYGDDHPIFNKTTIAQLYISMSESDLEWLMNPVNKYETDWKYGDLWFYNGIEDKDIKIGIRDQGSVSRSFSKKSWKIQFDKWHHIKEFYLKSAAFDPSYTREQLSTAITYSMGSPVARSSYANLYINNQFYGLYYIIEDVNKEFLTSRFGNNNGALYKCAGTLSYLGNDTDLYKNLTNGNSPSYDPKTDAAQDFSALVQFITVLNSNSSSFEQDISQLFDVDLFIRTYVMEVATGNWDGIFDANNFYLYLNPDINKFQYFRHDLDVSYGLFEGNPFVGNFSNRNVYKWTKGAKGYILPDRIISVPKFRNLFTYYFKLLLKSYFFPDGPLFDLANSLHQMASNSAIQDYWHHLDYGWSNDEFANSLTQTIVRSQVSPKQIFDSIQEFIAIRYQSALDQLDP